MNLNGNRLTSVPAEIGQLPALRQLVFVGNQLTSCAGGDRAAPGAGVVGASTAIS